MQEKIAGMSVFQWKAEGRLLCETGFSCERPLDGYMQQMEHRLKVCQDRMGILLDKLEMCYYVFRSTQLVSILDFLSMHRQGVLQSCHRPAPKKHKSTGGKFPEACFASHGTNVIIDIEPHTVSRLVVY
jgi:hypothetical protein